MKTNRIIIAGGTGFIGEELIRHFEKDSEVIVLTRGLKSVKTNSFKFKEDRLTSDNTRYVIWDAKHLGEWNKELENADILINLCGKTVNCRYNQKNKDEIMSSRVDTTRLLGDAIQKCIAPPNLWINASSATIYRHAEDRPQDEFTGEIENDFSIQVCKAWEKTFFETRTPFTRKVALRMAITLGNGGVMIPYFNLMKFGLGGRQGNGKQMYSWIHIDDTVRIIEWIKAHPEMEGVYNCSSPNPVSNEEFMSTLRTTAGHKFGLPAFEWMLKIGAAVIGTETELILKSRWVLPTKLLQAGYQFKYPVLEDAAKEIISKSERKQYHLF